MRQPVIQQRLKTGIAQHDFEARPGGRIAGQGCVNLVAQVFERHRDHYVIVVTATLAPLTRGRLAVAEARI